VPTTQGEDFKAIVSLLSENLARQLYCYTSVPIETALYQYRRLCTNRGGFVIIEAALYLKGSFMPRESSIEAALCPERRIVPIEAAGGF
jgi:hypothetical protein